MNTAPVSGSSPETPSEQQQPFLRAALGHSPQTHPRPPRWAAGHQHHPRRNKVNLERPGHLAGPQSLILSLRSRPPTGREPPPPHPLQHTPLHLGPLLHNNRTQQPAWALCGWLSGPDSRRVHPGSLCLRAPPWGPSSTSGHGLLGAKEDEKQQISADDPDPARCICCWQRRASAARSRRLVMSSSLWREPPGGCRPGVAT